MSPSSALASGNEICPVETAPLVSEDGILRFLGRGGLGVCTSTVRCWQELSRDSRERAGTSGTRETVCCRGRLSDGRGGGP